MVRNRNSKVLCSGIYSLVHGRIFLLPSTNSVIIVIKLKYNLLEYTYFVVLTVNRIKTENELAMRAVFLGEIQFYNTIVSLLHRSAFCFSLKPVITSFSGTILT